MKKMVLSTNNNTILLIAFSVILISFVCGATAEDTRLRIAAANITSGNDQSYQDPGKRIFQGLKPDIVMIQEFNVGGNTTAEIDAFVKEAFGSDYVWYREGGSEQIPNGIISRYPFIQSGEWIDSAVANRDFAWAKIDIPGDKDLWAVSVHLLTTSASERNTEATALKNYINANVPSGDYLVIGGDFNTGSRTESALSTLSSVVVVSSPYPADQNGNSNTNANRNDPYDWVVVDSDLAAIKTPLIIGNSSYVNGLVFDSRVYTPLSEVSPVLYGDSAASNMQHMAVVRDFLIKDVVPDDFAVSATSINFGTVDSSNAPFQDSSVLLTVTNPFTLQGVSFSGAHAAEFTLISPEIDADGIYISENVNLKFKWMPSVNDSVQRQAAATLTTSGKPSSFQINLTGVPSVTPQGNIDISGYILEQTASAVTITFPAQTVLSTDACLVIGRNATKAAFESFWGALPTNAVYINGTSIIGGNGFPQINGSEQYRLSDATSQVIDPLTGYLPSAPIAVDQNYQRNSTTLSTFTATTALPANATPGKYSGIKNNTGKVVISEVCDASGSGNYVYEFVELYYDVQAQTPTPLPTLTPTSTATPTPTQTPVVTPTITPTPTPEPTVTLTPTPTPTPTPVLTPTPSPTLTPTPSPTPSITSTPTPIPTQNSGVNLWMLK